MNLIHLFSSYDINKIDKDRTKILFDELDSLNGNRLLNTSSEDLKDYFYKQYMYFVPVLLMDLITVDYNEVDIDIRNDPQYFSNLGANYIKGTEIIVSIPFEGEKTCFEVQPTHFTSCPPIGAIENNNLLLSVKGIKLNKENVKSQIDRNIKDVNEYLSFLEVDFTKFNTQLKTLIHEKIQQKKQKLLDDQDLVASLGFNLKQNANMPKTFIAPEVRRKIIPSLPTGYDKPFKPEPVLSKDEFNHILTVIDNMSKVMERSPSAFVSMGEEVLRSHFLVQLNGHYEGQATGETFNYSGKTDIMIRVNNKNIFIAECKFWKGKESYLETINQILSYSCWRDTKVAIIIFNKNKNMSQVIETILSATPEHPNYKKLLEKKETDFKYLFAHKDDLNREMFLVVKVFDIPK
jgi:hypothetical protein